MRFLSLAVLSFALPALAEAPSAVLFEQDLVVNLAGEDVGTMTSLDVKNANGTKLLQRKSDLTIRRGATVTKLKTNTSVTLAADGAPQSYRFEKTDPGGSLVVNAVIVDGGKTLRMTSTQNGASVDNLVPLPKDATFAVALEHQVRSAPKDGMKIARPVVLEELGAVVPMTTTVTKTSTGSFLVSATFSTGGVTITTDEEIDAKGRTLVARTAAVGLVAYPWGKAPKDIEALLKGGKKADLLAVSTWKVKNVSLPAQRVVYRITTPDADLFTVPQDLRQKVIGRTKDYVDVEVKAGLTTAGPLTGEVKKRALSATPYEAVADPRIVKAARDAVVGAKDDREKVKLLAAFVFHHVEKKGLDRGYAPAIATLESKAGDCTEHSVLLSALLKSQGLPTRIVDGVVVDGGAAGYHEWVEVNLGEGFVPVDPTFNAWPAGPERLKLAEGSTLPDEHLGLSLAAARLLKSGVKLEVLSAE
ncbi:MAG: transglutaminase-like domain-containing protein [Deltaproteobacteria bacterium]|nr:transglutaminase-like domain-containing protein [Deltaproteobacteria bacterium]